MPSFRILFLVAIVSGCAVDNTGLLGPEDGSVDVASDMERPLDAAVDSDRPLDAGPDATLFDANLDVAMPDVGPDAVVRDAGDDGGARTTIESQTYTIVAHGGRTQLTGMNLDEVLGAQVGGVDARIIDQSASQLTVEIDDRHPIGDQLLVFDLPAGRTVSTGLTVIHLVIDELDQETGGGEDTRQFVDVVTGLNESVDLSGYTIVFFDGESGQAYITQELGATDVAGYWSIGNDGVDPPVDVIVADNTIQGDNTPDAVAIYQRASFPVGSGVSGTDVIDALVYTRSETVNNDLSGPLMVEGGRFARDEDEEGDEGGDSLQRCTIARRDARAWEVLGPSPRSAASCP